jgi:hypothetical protein
MNDQDQPPPLRHGELKDRPNFSGFTVRLDGCLALLLHGRGLILGPCTPDQLRDIGYQILAVADARAARLTMAGDAALTQLDEILATGETA